MPAANYNAAVLANGAAGENVMLLTARWDETTPAPACGQFYMLRAWKAEEAPLLSRPISVHRFDREKKRFPFYMRSVVRARRSWPRCGPGTPLR